MKSHTITNTLKKFIFVTAALAVALTTSYALATWSDPTGTPPANNVAAPVNVSTDPQTKPGMFTTAISRAADEMRAVEYCDYDGDNCISLASCSDGDVLTFDSGSLSCAAPSGGGGGGGGTMIVNEVHTRDECVAAGGTVMIEGAEAICRVAGNSCNALGAGWTQYENWSTVPSVTFGMKTGGACGSESKNGAQCTVGHGWSNTSNRCSWRKLSWTSDECQILGTNYESATRSQIGCY